MMLWFTLIKWREGARERNIHKITIRQTIDPLIYMAGEMAEFKNLKILQYWNLSDANESQFLFDWGIGNFDRQNVT